MKTIFFSTAITLVCIVLLYTSFSMVEGNPEGDVDPTFSGLKYQGSLVFHFEGDMFLECSGENTYLITSIPTDVVTKPHNLGDIVDGEVYYVDIWAEPTGHVDGHLTSYTGMKIFSIERISKTNYAKCSEFWRPKSQLGFGA